MARGESRSDNRSKVIPSDTQATAQVVPAEGEAERILAEQLLAGPEKRHRPGRTRRGALQGHQSGGRSGIGRRAHRALGFMRPTTRRATVGELA